MIFTTSPLVSPRYLETGSVIRILGSCVSLTLLNNMLNLLFGAELLLVLLGYEDVLGHQFVLHEAEHQLILQKKFDDELGLFGQVDGFEGLVFHWDLPVFFHRLCDYDHPSVALVVQRSERFDVPVCDRL